MSKGIRQSISPRQARSGMRPGGSTTQPRTATTTAATQQTRERRLSEIVDQGGVGVWQVKGSDVPIYALSREQAQAEAQRRGVKGALSLEGYVKLSEADRAKLQEATARSGQARQQPTSRTPSYRELMETKGYDKETALRIASNLKESERRSRKPEYGIAETQRREQSLKEAGEKLQVDRGRAEVEAQREYIESRGGAIGVLSEAEAARADRTYSTMKRYEVSEGQYDITAALADKAFTAAELREMGFSQADVSEATERVSMSSFPETSGKAKAAATTKTTGAEAFAGAKGKSASSLSAMTSVKPAQPVAKAGILSDVRLLPYRNKDGTYNLQRMVTSSVPTKTIRSAGFSDAQIAAALDAAMLASAQQWTPTLVGGLTTFSGVKGGVGSVPAIARIDPTSVKPTSTGLKAAATRNLLLRYQNKDASYDLQKAVEKGVSVKMLQTAGFSDAQIMAAINAAMKASGEKFGRDIAGETGVAAPKPRVPDMTQEERIDALAQVMRSINKEVEQKAISQEAQSRDIIRESERTSVALPGEERTWYHWPTGQTVSEYEYRRATDGGKNAKAEEYSLSARSARRGAINAVSTLFFAPARAGLPEVDADEVTKMEYLIGGAQLASWLAPAAPKGWAAGLQTGAGAVFAASTAQDWKQLSTAQRTIGVGASALLLTTGLNGLLKPSFKPVTVPLKDGGKAVVWSGLSIRGKPIIGVTRVPPNIKDIDFGRWVQAVTKTEDSILRTRRMLQKIGVVDDEIPKIMQTVEQTRPVKGTRSPYEPKSVDPADVHPQSLTADELGKVLRRVVQNDDLVDMAYGSVTIKAQLAPELRNWRQLGDIEIQFGPKATPEKLAKVAQQMVDDLNKPSPGKFSIDPRDPLRIVSQGHHAVELKLPTSGTGVGASPAARPTGAWGIEHWEKPITVELPGIGKLRIMRLSESMSRKMASITEIKPDGTVGPPAHRTKDIIDYYAILYTFKGPNVADDWARLYGLDPKAALKAAIENPPRLDAWEFIPSKGRATGSPTVSVSLPPSLAASVKAKSPALYKSISSPVTTSQAASLAASASAVAASPSASLAASTTSPSITAASDTSVSASEDEESPSPGAESPDDESPSPDTVSPSPDTPSPSPDTPSPEPVSPSPSPDSPSPSGSPSGSPGGGGGSPYPVGGSKPWRPGGSEPVTKRKRATDVDSEKDKDDDTGRVQWRQGAYWIMVEPPPKEGERQRNVQYSRRPFWGVRKVKGSPEETFARQGTPPKQFLYEMGVTRASIHSYEKPHLRWRQTRKSGRRRGRVI